MLQKYAPKLLQNEFRGRNGTILAPSYGSVGTPVHMNKIHVFVTDDVRVEREQSGTYGIACCSITQCLVRRGWVRETTRLRQR
jgi:hypothetical protein